MKKTLSAYQIKLIAIIAMFLDHLAHIIVHIPSESAVVIFLPVFMNMIGRLTMPIMCFFISEGYYHTKNLKKYFLRLFIFAIISQLPYHLFCMDTVTNSLSGFIKGNIFHTNVIFTLLLGLCALTLAKANNVNILIKAVGIVVIIALSRYSDWRIYGVIWVLIFGLFRHNPTKQFIWFSVFAVIRCMLSAGNNVISFTIQLCCLLAIPLLDSYNGEPGKKAGLMFYIFYPLHLLILGFIRYILLF